MEGKEKKKKCSKSKKEVVVAAGTQLIDQFLRSPESANIRSEKSEKGNKQQSRKFSQSGTVYPPESETEISKVCQHQCHFTMSSKGEFDRSNPINDCNQRGHPVNVSTVIAPTMTTTSVVQSVCTNTVTPISAAIVMSSAIQDGINGAVGTTKGSEFSESIHWQGQQQRVNLAELENSRSSFNPTTFSSTGSNPPSSYFQSVMGTHLMDKHKMSQPSYGFSDLNETTRLSTTLMSVQGQLLTQDRKHAEFCSRIEGLEYEQEQDNDMLRKQGKTIKMLEDRCNLMAEIMKKQEMEIENLQRKQKAANVRKIKNNVKIIGITMQEDSTLEQTVQSFFKDKMQIAAEIGITGIEVMKSGDPPPVIVKLSDFHQKKIIFDHAKNLKGVKTPTGKFYGVYSVLMEEHAEIDIRKRQIVKSNEALPVAQKHRVSLKKGTLSVDNAPYKPKYEQLKAADLLDITQEDWIKCSEVKAGTSKVQRHEGNSFAAYAIQVHSLKEICTTYRHFKMKYASAPHVMMAYRLAGTNKAYDEDYYDDKEHGGGRRLFRVLLDADAFCYARSGTT